MPTPPPRINVVTHRMQYMPIRQLVALGSLIAAALAAPSRAADSPHGPRAPEAISAARWIWTAGPRAEPSPTPTTGDQSGGRVFLQTQFELPSPPATAELMLIADMCQAEAYLNGQRVGIAEDYGPKLSVDAAPFLVAGANTLSIEGSRSSGPSAMAAVLVIRRGEETQVIVSGDHWRAWSTAPPGWPAAVAASAATDGSITGAAPAAADFGPLEREIWAPSGHGIGITAFDDYTQWEQALGPSEGPDPATFLIAPGFVVERVRAAKEGEGSWISIAFDPRGRLIISREDQGLLRFDLASGELSSVNDTLKECRGLLFVGNDLYASANESKGLYRLGDQDGDGAFEQPELILATEGGVGHGRNDLAAGPDGALYAIFGDSVDLPRDAFDRTSPLREARRGQRTSEGFLLRIDPRETDPRQRVQILCAGLRNPYGVDFNSDGEAFTYDADAEFDMGAPWYRPTRVRHLISAADYGWRGVTGQWPPYYPDHSDNGLPGFDVGKGSPTAVQFGARSHFPPPYREALFILDWAYGRIVAVHMAPRGASYACGAETFLKGRPLNVTDLTFGPDGAMYFVTGGRQTQSAVYRVRADRPAVDAPAAEHDLSPQQAARREHARQAREIRRRLETFHGRSDEAAIAAAWPWLDHADPAIRHAARLAVDHQSCQQWRRQAFEETRPLAVATLMLSLARRDDPSLVDPIVERLNQMSWRELTPTLQLILLDAYAELAPKFSTLSKQRQEETTARLEALYPDRSASSTHAAAVHLRLGLLLAALPSPSFIANTLDLLEKTAVQEERMQHLFALRNVNSGWTEAQRETYFTALREAGGFVGGQGMPEFLQRLRADAIASLPAESRPRWEQFLAAAPATAGDESLSAAQIAVPRTLVKRWTLDELAPLAAAHLPQASAERGKAIFAQALCARCHRIQQSGAAVGPDLSAAASRYSPRDLLDAILDPSKVVAEQYRGVQIVTSDGRVVVGQVAPGADYRSKSLRVLLQPLDASQFVELAKSDIEQHTPSPASPMPSHLLDTFTAAEIADLLLFLSQGSKAP